jgi:hypothetical protein
VTPARDARRRLPDPIENESPPPAPGRRPAAGVEALRRAIGRARAKIRALQTRAAAHPLPPPAVARLAALRTEVEELRRDLLDAIREAVPDDLAPPLSAAAPARRPCCPPPAVDRPD